MKKQSKLVRYIYFGAIVALVLIFGLFVLEKTQVTNFYNKPVSDVTEESVRPVNDVQYTPADPTDNDVTNQQKQDGTIDQKPQTPANGSPINVVLTAAGQDIGGGPVIIKVLLNDVTNGTCDIVLTQNSTTKKYSASVVSAGNYYTCDGFEIPMQDLRAGSWNLTATVTSADRSGSATKTIEITP